MPQDINGIVINEILADSNIGTQNNATGGFDTDGDGNFRNSDEFIELLNTSEDTVNIGGWTLSDDDGNSFEFDTGTTIASGDKVTVVTRYNTDPLPNGFFSIGTQAIWNNSGDQVILSNGDTENLLSITASYGTSTGGDSFGTTVAEGQSLQRTTNDPDVVVTAEPTPGADNPECFLTGTRVLTESGYKLVEELEIGDKVQTAEGNFEAVKWIGYQTVNPVDISNPLRANPILVKAGALGKSLPCNDLYLSPDHALLVDGLLINAGALVNDVSIIKTEPTETFVYHSIELENHALLMVEGTFAESYMPHHEDRANYDNGAEYEELYSNGSSLILYPLDYPRVSSMNKVPRLAKEKLLAISCEFMALSA